MRGEIYYEILRIEKTSLSQKFESYPSMIRWAVRNEMAMTFKDMLSMIVIGLRTNWKSLNVLTKTTSPLVHRQTYFGIS
jgi:hypothetical protein